MRDRIDKGDCAAVVVGQRWAAEVGEWLSNCHGYDDDGDEEETVCAGVDEEGELGVVVEDVCYGAVKDCDTGLWGFYVNMWEEELSSKGRLTTLRVPTRTFGGAVAAATISATKLAVMPMMEMRQMTCIARTTVKVAPRAPYLGAGMLSSEVGFQVK